MSELIALFVKEQTDWSLYCTMFQTGLIRASYGKFCGPEFPSLGIFLCGKWPPFCILFVQIVILVLQAELKNRITRRESLGLIHVYYQTSDRLSLASGQKKNCYGCTRPPSKVIQQIKLCRCMLLLCSSRKYPQPPKNVPTISHALGVSHVCMSKTSILCQITRANQSRLTHKCIPTNFFLALGVSFLPHEVSVFTAMI